MSSFEEVKVQKKLVKEGRIEVVENLTFMTEARRKELEGERLREESTSTPMPVRRGRRESSRVFLILITAGTSRMLMPPLPFNSLW